MKASNKTYLNLSIPIVITLIISSLVIIFYNLSFSKSLYRKLAATKSVIVKNNLHEILDKYYLSNQPVIENLFIKDYELTEIGFSNVIVLNSESKIILNYAQLTRRDFSLPKELDFMTSLLFKVNMVTFDQSINSKNYYVVFIPHIDKNGAHTLNYIFFYDFETLRMKNFYFTQIVLGLSIITLLVCVFMLFQFHKLIRKTVTSINKYIHNRIYGKDVSNKVDFTYIEPFGLLEQKITYLIAGRKELEKKFLDVSEKFSLLIDNSNDGIMMEDTDGFITFCNRRFAEILGYDSESELEGRKTRDILYDSESIETYVNETNSRKDSISSTYKLKFMNSNGFPVICLISGNPQFDNDSRIVGSYAAITDITRLEQLENEQRISSLVLNNFFDNSNEGFLVLDHTFNVMNANLAFCNLYNLPKSAILRLNLISAMKNYSEFNSQFNTLVYDKSLNTIEYFEPSLNKWILLSVTKNRDEYNRNYFLLLKDMTEMHKYESFHSVILDYSEAFFFIEDRNGEIQFLSHSFTAITGHDTVWLSFNKKTLFDNLINKTIEIERIDRRKLIFSVSKISNSLNKSIITVCVLDNEKNNL